MPSVVHLQRNRMDFEALESRAALGERPRFPAVDDRGVAALLPLGVDAPVVERLLFDGEVVVGGALS